MSYENIESVRIYDEVQQQHRNSADNTRLDKITIRDGSRIIYELYDDKEYSQKINTIMESASIKEELGETVLWYNILEERKMFRVKTKELWIITNHRVLQIDGKRGAVIQLPLKYVDIVVVNARTDYQSEGVGVFVGVPASIASGMGFLQRKGSSRRIGDLVFLLNGQILLIFNNVLDPSGVKRLIDQAKRQMYKPQSVFV